MNKLLLSNCARCIAASLGKSKLQDNGRSIHSKAGSHTLSAIIGGGVLSNPEESTTKSFQMQIVNTLGLGERSKALNLLLDYSSRSSSLKADDFTCILDYCARSPDPLFVMQTLRVIEEKNISLDNKSFLLMVQALCRGGYLEEASHLINNDGESDQLYPTLPVYNTFLEACAEMNSVFHANKCLDWMDEQRVGKDQVTYAHLLKVAVSQKDLSAVHQIWKDYIKYYNPSLSFMEQLLCSFKSLGDLKSAFETLQLMVVLITRNRDLIDINVKARRFSSALDIPIPSDGEIGLKITTTLKDDNDSGVVRVDVPTHNLEQSTVSEMPNKEADNATVGFLDKTGIPITKILWRSFNHMMDACAEDKNCELAEELMLQMQSLGIQISSYTYDRFIKAVVPVRGFSEGMELLKVMRESNLKPYTSTFGVLSVACSKALELDLAEALLDEEDQLYSYPYNALLAACDTMDKPERALRVLAKMFKLNVQLDITTYELLFSLFGGVNARYEKGDPLSQTDSAKRINVIAMDMAKKGVQHSHLSMKNLLRALGTEGMISDLFHYLNVAENLFCRINVYMGAPMYNTVLQPLHENRETHMATTLFKNMKSSGLPPNAATYNIMIDCCSVIRCYRSALALVSMMIRDGYIPQTVTYTTLIKILLKDEKFDEAFDLLDQASSEGIHHDVLTYNTILKIASEKGRIDVIESIIEEMFIEQVQPDPSTCEYVFTAYAEQGLNNTAFEALHVLSIRMLGEDDDILQEKKAEFEEKFILTEDLEAESQIIRILLNIDHKLGSALLNLRWCAMNGFPISWSTNHKLCST